VNEAEESPVSLLIRRRSHFDFGFWVLDSLLTLFAIYLNNAAKPQENEYKVNEKAQFLRK
jgi:hypothetical protein